MTAANPKLPLKRILDVVISNAPDLNGRFETGGFLSALNDGKGLRPLVRVAARCRRGLRRGRPGGRAEGGRPAGALRP